MRSVPATLGALTAAASLLAACAAGPIPAAEGAQGVSPSHVDGLMHGAWRIGYPGGFVEEGRYVAGRLHGEWTLRDAAGEIVARELWCHGRAWVPGAAVCE